MNLKKNEQIEYCNNQNGRCLLSRAGAHNFSPRLYFQFSGLLTNKAHVRRLRRVIDGALKALEEVNE